MNNTPRYLGSSLLVILVVIIYAVVTYVTVDISHGGLSPSNSNTPNASVPGPPAFR